jgi:glycerol-3-phosphate dehydrogenase
VRDASGGLIEEDTALMLAESYGMRTLEIASMCREDRALGGRLIPGRPEIVAQVRFAAREELAPTRPRCANC